MTTQVNIYEARTQFSQLIDRAIQGEEIVIAKSGEPVVKLVRVTQTAERKPGILAGQIWIADDFDEFTEQDEQDWYGDVS